MLQEPEIDRYKYQNDSDVDRQPLPKVLPEEQDVYADHDRYQYDHENRGDCLSSHRYLLLRAMEWSKSGTGHSENASAAGPHAEHIGLAADRDVAHTSMIG
jgi:hypothetical protein